MTKAAPPGCAAGTPGRKNMTPLKYLNLKALALFACLLFLSGFVRSLELTAASDGKFYMRGEITPESYPMLLLEYAKLEKPPFAFYISSPGGGYSGSNAHRPIYKGKQGASSN